jgi:hypothetical protein
MRQQTQSISLLSQNNYVVSQSGSLVGKIVGDRRDAERLKKLLEGVRTVEILEPE